MNEIDEEIKILEEQIKKTPTHNPVQKKHEHLTKKPDNRKAAKKRYLKPPKLTPASPAAEACKSIMDILEFYNKDLYNP